MLIYDLLNKVDDRLIKQFEYPLFYSLSNYMFNGLINLEKISYEIDDMKSIVSRKDINC